ncbi:MAG: aminoglycoside phosphotransferase family protein [Sedimentisphaerales bacterium]|nr:aminoglycoside phosphotransferase family protein [Sedimentisphaerales bacterium]
MMEHDIKHIAQNFNLDGKLIRYEPFGSGHINDTYCLTCEKDDRQTHYILQRINHEVFKNPPAMMENIRRVTNHIRRKLQEQQNKLASRQLVVIDTKDGSDFCRDDRGNYWRVYNRIENAVTYDTIESPELAYEAARMFGRFAAMLTDLPGPALYETIPDFHTTPKRFKTFTEVLGTDPCNRAKGAGDEIDFVLENAGICDVLLNHVDKGEIPVRITHNDTKINNVLLDEKTHEGVCVIDLDTVMPGLSLYDFGDMVRTATNPAEEDERDLSKVTMRMPIFEMLLKGFAEETHKFLTPAEKKNMVFAGKLITFEQMIRFGADHLAGDIYYKIHREGHNLDRCRTQMKMVQSIITQEEAMNALTDSVFEKLS